MVDIRLDHREPVTPIAEINPDDAIRTYFEDVTSFQLEARYILF